MILLCPNYHSDDFRPMMNLQLNHDSMFPPAVMCFDSMHKHQPSVRSNVSHLADLEWNGPVESDHPNQFEIVGLNKSSLEVLVLHCEPV